MSSELVRAGGRESEAGCAVFEVKPPLWQIIGCFAGAGLMFAMLFVTTFLSAFSKTTTSASHDSGLAGGMAAGIGVPAFFLVARAVMLMRHSMRVVIDDLGLTVEGWISRRSFRWEEIVDAREKRESSPMGQTTKLLVLHHRDGKVVAGLPLDQPGFQTLAGEIRRRIAPHAVSAAKRAAMKERLKVMIPGALLALMFGTGGVFSTREWLREGRLEEKGEMVEARVVGKKMKAVTPYLEYEFVHQGKRERNESMVTEEAYQEATEGGTVPVRVEPGDTSNHRVTGSAESKVGGVMVLAMWGFCALGLGGVALGIAGIDIASANGKVKIRRMGEATPTPPSESQLPHLEEVLPESGPAFTHPRPPAKKPMGLLTLGGLAIAVGLLWTVLGVMRGVMTTQGAREVQLARDAGTVVVEPLNWALWHYADAALGLLLVATGVGLLRVRGWARPLGIAVALLSILSTAGEMTLGIRSMINAPEVPGEAGVAVRVANIMMVLVSLLGLILPVILVGVLSKRDVGATLRHNRPPEN